MGQQTRRSAHGSPLLFDGRAVYADQPLVTPRGQRARRPPKISNRDALEGILHILRTGTPWRDLPQAYGAWHTIYMRWQRWVERGVWGNILLLLTRLKRIDLHLVFLDSTVVRVHQHAAGAPKKRATKPSAARAAG